MKAISIKIFLSIILFTGLNVVAFSMEFNNSSVKVLANSNLTIADSADVSSEVNLLKSSDDFKQLDLGSNSTSNKTKKDSLNLTTIQKGKGSAKSSDDSTLTFNFIYYILQVKLSEVIQ